MRKNNYLEMSCRPILLLVFLLGSAMFLANCKKDDEEVKPKSEYVLEYVVNPVGDLTVSEIVYTDSTGVERIVTGKRDFRLSFKAETDFQASLRTKGTFVNGGIFIAIQAYNLKGTAVNVTKNDGFSGGSSGSKSFDLSLSARLP